MRILPRLPLGMAVIVASMAAVLAAPASPASAQDFDLSEWAKSKEADRPELCEQDSITFTGDSLIATPWETVQMGLDEAHLHNTGRKDDGTSVVVAVIDSGVYADHPTFGGRVLPGADPWHVQTNGHCDRGRHGTGVAAIIAGGHDNLRFRSVAPDALILPIRLFPDGETDGRSAGLGDMLADSINAAVDVGVDVINVSLAVLDTPALHAAVKNAVANGVVVVAAAGNNRINMDTPGDEDPVFYPAAYPETIAVAASNEHGNWGEFSNRGEAIDLLAPGVGVTLAAPSGSGYYLADGTSFAAPYVSGAAALLIGHYGDLATPEFIRQRLIDTAVAPGNQHNIYQGYGLLNIREALTAPVRIGADDHDEEPSVEPAEIDFVQVPTDPLRTEKIISLAALGGVLVAIILVFVFRKLLPNGKRRGWKPGARQADPSI